MSLGPTTRHPRALTCVSRHPRALTLCHALLNLCPPRCNRSMLSASTARQRCTWLVKRDFWIWRASSCFGVAISGWKAGDVMLTQLSAIKSLNTQTQQCIHLKVCNENQNWSISFRWNICTAGALRLTLWVGPWAPVIPPKMSTHTMVRWRIGKMFATCWWVCWNCDFQFVEKTNHYFKSSQVY